MTTEIPADKRHFHRISFHEMATLRAGTTCYPCEVMDLSLKGCLLKFEQPWQAPPEHSVILELQLSNEVSINMALTPVHYGGKEIGFKCEHIDIESISQLRRLVELNLGNSELLERDIHALTAL